jgi:hypothetical protein
MMRRAWVSSLSLGIILLLTHCVPSPPSTPTSIPGLGLHLLVEVTGDLSHKRPGWQAYQPLSFGAALDRQDLLQAAPDGEGLIVCADLSLAPVPAGYQGGLPCSRAEPVLSRGESWVIGPRREEPLAVSVPYVISPRHTFIQTPYPLLRWHPSATETITYTVRVWGGDLDWRTETTATELRYPNDAPPMTLETPYYLTVVDTEGRSSEKEQTTLDVSFSLLPSEEAKAARSLVTQARGLDLGERATRLLETEIYAAHGLRADAIALLEELAAGEDAPAVHRRLGDLNLEVGLYAEAREAYGHALDGYRALGGKDGEADVLAGLGLAYRGDGDDATAQDYLGQALCLYQAIGDADGVARVERVLAKMGGHQ